MASTVRNRDPWLTRERVLAYATILAVVEMGLFAFCVAGSHGLIVPLDHQPSTDFVSFHAAGALADAGTPWLAYDRVAHHAAEQAAIGMTTAYNSVSYTHLDVYKRQIEIGVLDLAHHQHADIRFDNM